MIGTARRGTSTTPSQPLAPPPSPAASHCPQPLTARSLSLPASGAHGAFDDGAFDDCSFDDNALEGAALGSESGSVAPHADVPHADAPHADVPHADAPHADALYKGTVRLIALRPTHAGALTM